MLECDMRELAKEEVARVSGGATYTGGSYEMGNHKVPKTLWESLRFNAAKTWAGISRALGGGYKPSTGREPGAGVRG